MAARRGRPVLLLWLAFLQLRPEVTTPGPGLYTWFEMIVPMATEWVAGGPDDCRGNGLVAAAGPPEMRDGG
jgi:hypothetical protein